MKNQTFWIVLLCVLAAIALFELTLIVLDVDLPGPSDEKITTEAAALDTVTATEQGDVTQESLLPETEILTETEYTVPTSETEPETETVPDDSETLDSLQEKIRSRLSNESGEWVVYLELLSDGDSICVEKDASEDSPMIAASIVKIFLMAEVYEQIENGSLFEGQVQNDLFNMIAWSNNDATNSLLTVLGQGNADRGMQIVNDYAASIGCYCSKFNRLMGVTNGQQNYVSVNDCAKLLRMIYRGECVSASASAKMMDLLKQWKYGDYIPAGVPDGVTIAHKGGDLYGYCRGDVGIVFADDNPYLICILANNVSSASTADDTIVELSTLVWDTCG